MRARSILRDVDYPAIDGLRFYAAFLVFLMHVAGSLAIEYLGVAPKEFSTTATAASRRFLVYLIDGNHGVDVFFIISGFLMARLVLQAKSFSYGRFLMHRVKRIYPAFLASLVIAAAADVLLFGWTWSAAEFAKNLIFLNAWPDAVSIQYNHVSWSLGYEFAFYVAVPGLLLLARFVSPTTAAAGALALAALALPDAFIRMTALFAGAVIGSVDDARLKRLAQRIPLVPLLLGYTACGVIKHEVPWVGLYFYPFVLCASLLFVKTVFDAGSVLHRICTAAPIRWLGTLSFSVYLYHSVVASIAAHFLSPHPATIWGAAIYLFWSVSLTVLAALASYMLFERRYFQGHRSAARQDLSAPAAQPS